MRTVRAPPSGPIHVFRPGRDGGSTWCGKNATRMRFVYNHHSGRYDSADDSVKPGDEKLTDCRACQAEVVAYLMRWDLV